MIDLHCAPKGQQSHDLFWKRIEFRIASFSSTSAMMIADVVTETEEENVDVI